MAVLSLGINAATPELPIPGYGVTDLTWNIKVTSNGPVVQVNGTVQEVIASLSKDYPELQATIDERSAAALDVRTIVSHLALHKRDYTRCNYWPYAHTVDITRGIRDLRGVPGQPGAGPGPGNCGRVSCYAGSQIWWCNDNTSPFSLGSFSDIANAAQVIVNDCSRGGNDVSGQRFHDNNINVIVRGPEDSESGYC
ncbi:Hypothetical protein D9617_13g100090 [Elsinoe fawcettii]|nr:Hypothetical protein D9617_13g100090 [Elsinoe fawcettii]